MSKVKRRDHPAGNKYKNYIGNKNEGHGFVNKQRERVSFQYKKLKRKEDRKKEYLARQTADFPENEVEKNSEPNPYPSQPKYQKNKNFQPNKFQDTKKKSEKHVFKKLQEEADERKKEKQKQREEMLMRQKEREEALANYKEKRRENYKKLSKKTKHGQPVMKNQIEFLLDKIVKSVKNT